MKLLFMYAAHCIGMVHIVNEKFVQEKTIFGLNFGTYFMCIKWLEIFSIRFL